jgi:hypothetical protein
MSIFWPSSKVSLCVVRQSSLRGVHLIPHRQALVLYRLSALRPVLRLLALRNIERSRFSHFIPLRSVIAVSCQW